MKRLFTFLALVLLGAAFALPLSAMDAPKDPITIVMPEGGKVTKPSVVFPHVAHGALDCMACHHKWDGKAEVKACKSAGCHDDVTTKRGERSYYQAYHMKGMQSCLGCHKQMKREGAEKYGPTKCQDCHVK